MITWILSAQRAEARVYVHSGPGKGLSLVKEIQHEEGRLRDGDVNADRPGRARDSHGRRHAMSPAEAPHERIAAGFARELAKQLSQHRARGDFDQVLLVAAPHMLGLIREALDAPTRKSVGGSIDKEYPAREQDKLERELNRLISV